MKIIATLEQELSAAIDGEARFDAFTRKIYSTDASMYEIEPVGLVLPKTDADVQKTLRIAQRHNVAILPRGGGTSLAGQTVGEALVIDFSKYMNQVLELDANEEWARVQPGLVQDHFNDYLSPRGFVFGPNTSTSSRATIGGMLGNNSSGSRSIVYGKTVDHVIEVSGYFADGEPFSFGPVDAESLEELMRQDSRTGRLHKALKDIVDDQRGEIEDRYPKIMRRVSGYNLDELARETQPFNLAKLMVGAEGTLAVVTEAKVRVCPKPKALGVLVVHFHSIEEALAASTIILAHDVAAIEIIDRVIIELAKQNLEAQRLMSSFVVGDPDSFLTIEFFAENDDEAKEKVRRLHDELEAKNIGYARVPLDDPAHKQDCLNMRKAGLGFLLGRRGDWKPYAFVEDCAVAPERLLDYYRHFEAIMKKYDTATSYYGHTSVGLLHLRPLINLKDNAEIKKMAAIAEEVSDLVLEYGGAMSGEHGDGLARSQWIPKFFGEKLYGAFVEVKRLFDPENRMNPGKIVHALPFTQNLRFDGSYKTPEIPTIMDFSSDGGFARAVELCNGVGACRKRDGTMCPSYQATMEEEHSTRGRANALREVITNGIPGEDLGSERLYEVLDLCLSCKGCKAECPSSVDMAKIKAEVLQAYYDKNGVPLRVRMMGRIARINRLSAPVAPIVNWTLENRFVRSLLDRFLGIDKRRRLPPLVTPTFEDWFEARPAARSADTARGKVLFLNDTFTNFNYPEIGKAAVKVLEAAGFEVGLAETGCCGRPMISHGLLREGQKLAEENISRLSPAIEAGLPIIGVEPSCLLTFRDEYPDLVAGDAPKRLAENSYMLEEFLQSLHDKGELDLKFKSPKQQKALFHGHCHQKALVGTGPSLGVLGMIPDLEVTQIPSGCCGMAGSFGYEKEHFDISLAIGETKLFPALRAGAEDATTIANGVSCRQQISAGVGKKALHIAEVLADALDE